MPSLGKACSITAWLSLESDKLTAAEVTEQLGVSPDSSHAIGDRRGKGDRTWEMNGWKIFESFDAAWDNHYEAIEQTGELLLKRIAPVADRFKGLTEVCLGQLLIGTISVAVPGLHLGSATLAQLAALGVELEIDVLRVEDDHQDD